MFKYSYVIFIILFTTASSADVRDFEPALVVKEVPEIIKKAKNGDNQAQFDMAIIFGRGIGVEKNPGEARKWSKMAAENGHPEAQFWEGYRFYYAHGEQYDLKKAIYWYEKSAVNGYVDAQYMLADIYDRGVENMLDPNKEHAKKWYTAAANNGHALSSLRLGCMYYFGENVGKDNEKALYWLTKYDAEINMEFISTSKDKLIVLCSK